MSYSLVLYFVLVVVLSLTLNWFVQLGYYIYQSKSKSKNNDPFGGQRTLLEYYTGIIGDMVISPILNLLMFWVIWRSGFKIGVPEFVLAAIVAFTVGIGVHYTQGRMKLTNWSMPKPFKWEFPGWWHMVSLPIEMGFVMLFLEDLWVKTETIFTIESTRYAVWGILFLGILFVYLFLVDNSDARLRR